jgi:hypothetical protein
MPGGADESKSKDAQATGKIKTPKCTNHVPGAYWDAPCPNCGAPVEQEDRKAPDPMNNKRNA